MILFYFIVKETINRKNLNLGNWILILLNSKLFNHVRKNCTTLSYIFFDSIYRELFTNGRHVQFFFLYPKKRSKTSFCIVRVQYLYLEIGRYAM